MISYGQFVSFLYSEEVFCHEATDRKPYLHRRSCQYFRIKYSRYMHQPALSLSFRTTILSSSSTHLSSTTAITSIMPNDNIEVVRMEELTSYHISAIDLLVVTVQNPLGSNCYHRKRVKLEGRPILATVSKCEEENRQRLAIHTSLHHQIAAAHEQLTLPQFPGPGP